MDKIKLALHIIGQILAQGAIIALVPEEYRPLLQAIVVIIGLVLTYLDPTNAYQNLGLTKAEYAGKVKLAGLNK